MDPVADLLITLDSLGYSVLGNDAVARIVAHALAEAEQRVRRSLWECPSCGALFKRRNSDSDTQRCSGCVERDDLLAVCKLAMNAFEKNWAINWDDVQRAIDRATPAAHGGE